MATLAALDLYRFYHTGTEETRALRGGSFALDPDEFVALVGPSGSGKSTLLACLAGLDVPDGGQVELMGERIARLPEPERTLRRRRHVGMLTQSRNLLPGLTAEENVRLPMRLAGRPDGGRAAGLLADVGLDARRGAMPSELSGGEAARAGLAVALALSPSLLIADEPSAEVDAATEADLLRLLSERCAAGSAVLAATHSRTLAASATRVLRLDDGRIVDDARSLKPRTWPGASGPRGARWRPCCPRPSPSPPGTGSPWWAPPAAASPPCSTSWRVSTIPAPARSPGPPSARARRCGRSRWG